MMKTAAAVLLSLILFPACREAADPDITAAEALTRRILPRNHGAVGFEKLPGQENGDRFTLRSEGDRIVIGGNSAGSMAFGLNYYLKNYCDLTVTWYRRDTLREPDRLPQVTGTVEASAKVPHRFFLNYCTSGYSLNWWQWEDWERLIDWMALNGVNMALATTAQESVWYKVWSNMGLSRGEILSYFTGPSYLGWHRMANVDAWHGPLPESWLEGQLRLQQRIVARERELGIRPIFTSFTGHVPGVLKEHYPGADISRLNPWGGFGEAYNTYYLNPEDPLFGRIQEAFMQEQERLFGRSHIYGADPFNELDPPDWEPDYLARAARLTYESMARFDPEAVWLQMAWVFYHKRKHWTPERLRAYLTAVPEERLLMLDYYCDRTEIWRRTESFYGRPFIWCYLGNFGGNTMLAGDLHDAGSKLDSAYRSAGPGFSGVGCTLEGLDVNPFMYEYVLDRAWDLPLSDREWIERLADRRLGHGDEHMRKAWRLLCDSIYREASTNRSSMVCARPDLKGYGKWNSSKLCYDNRTLLQAWGELLAARGSDSPSYRFDCVNIGRQCLENHFGKLAARNLEAYRRGDRTGVETASAEMLDLLDDLEALLGSDGYFLLGKWIADARRWGETAPEKAYFERDARNILTTWGGRKQSLNDYANRCWAGLVGSYYKPRWEMFREALIRSLDEGKPLDEEALRERMYDFEWEWVGRTDPFPAEPQGDPVALSRRMYGKYRKKIAGN